ncbi:MAG: metal-dependent transcriptional regulator [Spirochaetales bacterium]|uniref:Transcriptional regulator MntR n=1 Tax=Candidatus Thalassospirochaeta sargassi TaxID=3119039 RepID=A0AAJ1MJX1_9SPIO|nr:metal-dependent transcriptional regulator [Spirochaetales bacterium]
MDNCKSLSHSLEDYLEAILILETKNRVARVRDIAAHLDVQMPSVTGAVKSLRDKGLVDYEKNSFICLTEEGKKTAEEIFNKHSVLVEFLENVLLLSHEKAVAQACNIEHVIDSETATRFSNCSAYIKQKLESKGVLKTDDWRKNIEKGL